MRNKPFIFVPVLLACFHPAVNIAQDIHFSQFYFTSIHNNPASAGAFSQKIKTGISYRDQWKRIDVNYRQYYFSFEANLFEKKNGNHLGLGLTAFNDKSGEGLMKQSYLTFSPAYHIQIAENNFLSAGFQLGFGQRSINNSALTWDLQYDGSQFNPNLPSGESLNITKNYLDVSTGLIWNGAIGKNNLSFGLAGFHLNSPVVSFMNDQNEKLLKKYTAFSMAKIPLPLSNTEIRPSVMYSLQGGHYELVIGSLFRYELKEASKYTGFVKGTAFSLGGFYRLKDAIIISSVIEMAGFKLGLSYDLNISTLKQVTNSRGGCEISMWFTNPNPFGDKNKKVKPFF